MHHAVRRWPSVSMRAPARGARDVASMLLGAVDVAQLQRRTPEWLVDLEAGGAGIDPGIAQRAAVNAGEIAAAARAGRPGGECRSEEHTSDLQSLMRISYAVFCLTKK